MASLNLHAKLNDKNVDPGLNEALAIIRNPDAVLGVEVEADLALA